jgi:hypothetical protein
MCHTFFGLLGANAKSEALAAKCDFSFVEASRGALTASAENFRDSREP